MTDPRDALLAEAARLLTIADDAGYYERRHMFAVEDDAKIRAWLARYEAERPGRGDAIAEAEQRGAERERAACHELVRNYAVERDAGITAKEGIGDDEGAADDAVAYRAAYAIAYAIAARTAPATPGKEDGE